MEVLVGAEPGAAEGGGKDGSGGADRVGLPLRVLRWWWRGWTWYVRSRMPEIRMGRGGFDEAE